MLANQNNQSERPKRGRPPLPPAQLRKNVIKMRVNDAESEQLASRAHKEGFCLAEWVRWQCGLGNSRCPD